MSSPELLQRVARQCLTHCAARGYVDGPNWNPLTPWDSVAALALARLLVGQYDHFVAIAPEGHVYGYFFAQLGARVLSVFVDYPPRRVDLVEDLSEIKGGRVLLLEDDVISGISLRLTVTELLKYAPASLCLYLGREAAYQQVQNVPPEIEAVYLAEQCLDPVERARHEAEFLAFFSHLGRFPD